MMCRMPELNLESFILEEVNASEFGVINSTGRGVAAYRTADNRHHIDVYIGLKLDGVRRYSNISKNRPDIIMQFALKPTVSCQRDDLDFDRNTDTTIVIEVSTAPANAIIVLTIKLAIIILCEVIWICDGLFSLWMSTC